VGYGLMSLIYRWTGTPPDFWTHILSGLMGIILFAGLANLARLLINRFSKNGRQHRAIHSQLLNAMTRIAQGDFDVYVNPQDVFIMTILRRGSTKSPKNSVQWSSYARILYPMYPMRYSRP
jgi:two-component system phosphate regulon sensor histidine kinase PhoR